MRLYSQEVWTADFRQALQGSERIILAVKGEPLRVFGALILLVGLLVTLAGGAALVIGYLSSSQAVGQGNPWVAPFVGGFFALIGYWMTFFVLRLEFDLIQRRWRHLEGVTPFVRCTEGSLDEWEHVRLERGERSVGQGGSYLAWALTLRARDDSRPALALPHFEFPCQDVDVAEATRLAQELASKLNLPLRYEDESVS